MEEQKITTETEAKATVKEAAENVVAPKAVGKTVAFDTETETSGVPEWMADTASEGKAKTIKPKTVKGRKKSKGPIKIVKRGRAYIHATYNNTMVTLTDSNGNAISWCSAGVVGFKGPKKSTPYAAGMIVKNAADTAKERGLEEVSVYVKGVGMGREAAIRALYANGLNILAIKDVTPIPHNGCRRRKRRRV